MGGLARNVDLKLKPWPWRALQRKRREIPAGRTGDGAPKSCGSLCPYSLDLDNQAIQKPYKAWACTWNLGKRTLAGMALVARLYRIRSLCRVVVRANVDPSLT